MQDNGCADGLRASLCGCFGRSEAKIKDQIVQPRSVKFERAALGRNSLVSAMLPPQDIVSQGVGKWLASLHLRPLAWLT